VTASGEHWVDVCEQTLTRDDREEIRLEFASRYRQLPFVEQMQHLLNETFSKPSALSAGREWSGHSGSGATANTPDMLRSLSERQ
jgi:hypothetical protein